MRLLNHACMHVRWFTLVAAHSCGEWLIYCMAATGRACSLEHAGKPMIPLHLTYREFRSDLACMVAHLQPWNGVGLVRRAVLSPQFGCILRCFRCLGLSECMCGSAWSAQLKWDQVAALWDISARELLPVVLASAVWGCLWSGAV